MTDEQRARVIKIIAEQLGIEEHHVTPDKSIVADFGADSLDTWEILIEMEDAFDIRIVDEAVEKCDTVGDWIGLVERELGARHV